MQQEIILGNRFLTMPQHFTIIDKGIKTYKEGWKIFFKFETLQVCKELNIVNLIQKKKTHIKQIKTEIKQKHWRKIWNAKKSKIGLRHIEKTLRKICALLSQMPWIERNIKSLSHTLRHSMNKKYP